MFEKLPELRFEWSSTAEPPANEFPSVYGLGRTRTKARAYALKTEEGLEIGVVPRGVELFAFDAGLAAGVAAQLVEGQPT